MTRRHSLTLIVTALAVAWAAVLPAPPGSAVAPNGRVRIKAVYIDADKVRHPLAGVEVWILEDYGIQRFACTNQSGFAVFEDVEPGVIHTAGMGPSFGVPRCDNAEFVNPVDGRFMFSVVYKAHRGVLPTPGNADGFYPIAGETTRIPLGAKDVRFQRQVCAGLRVTEVLTPADDEWVGTAGQDIVNALNGDDTLDGGGGVDYLCGGKGNDLLRGGGSGDVLLGQNGKDELHGQLGFDILDGGSGLKDKCNGELMFDCER